MPIQEIIEHEQNSVDNHIQRSETDRDNLIDSIAEALKRIYAEKGSFEETDSNTGQSHADHCHYNPECLFVFHIQHAF